MHLPSGSNFLSHVSLAIALLVGSCAVTLAMWLATGLTPALAATPASTSTRVEATAREHLLTQARDAGLLNPSVAVTLLPRGEVQACARNIEVEAIDTRHVTRMRFAAICSAEPVWRTEFIVRGALKAEVVVATADLKAGEPIGADQLALERRDLSAATDALSDPSQVVGRSSRRALRSGQVVGQRWLVETILVKRGAKVTIVARNVGVEVHVAGVATQAGRRGEIVDVRNTANGKIIRARVIGENSVEPAADMSIPSAAQ